MVQNNSRDSGSASNVISIDRKSAAIFFPALPQGEANEGGGESLFIPGNPHHRNKQAGP